ncbi:hypothetical protein BCA37_25500 [Mycobacterium sp. djl-10]|nr:hypothetical protein BCA37_25500 [Mycobacterium sp. djl-10]
MCRRVAGKIAVVTGGARGMGRSHVETLARQGAMVFFGDIEVEAGQRAEVDLRAEGLPVRFQRLDVTSAVDWAQMARSVREAGGLHIIVNNAGVVDTRGAEETGESDWARVIDVNQKGVYLGLRTLVPVMRDSGGGSIINVSSVYGLVGAVGYIAYSASKGAVTVMTKSAAATYGRDNIRVNSIHPGAIQTPMLDLELAGLHPGAAAALCEATPLGRFAGPEEVSACVLFLASEESSFVSGAELVVDGGLIAAR